MKDSNNDSLQLESQDHVASVARAVLGTLPIVGPLLTELVGVVVPELRIERLAKFAQELEERLESVELQAQEQLRTNEHFSELLEEGLRQAGRSLSDERREYIASLVANSLEPEAISHAESRHLLRILGELNDVEIIWLRFYLNPTIGRDDEFAQTHRDVLRPISRERGQPQSEREKAALQESYKQHLAQLGLLEPQETRSGRTTYKISELGRLLLREIGLLEDSE